MMVGGLGAVALAVVMFLPRYAWPGAVVHGMARKKEAISIIIIVPVIVTMPLAWELVVPWLGDLLFLLLIISACLLLSWGIYARSQVSEFRSTPEPPEESIILSILDDTIFHEGRVGQTKYLLLGKEPIDQLAGKARASDPAKANQIAAWIKMLSSLATIIMPVTFLNLSSKNVLPLPFIIFGACFIMFYGFGITMMIESRNTKGWLSTKEKNPGDRPVNRARGCENCGRTRATLTKCIACGKFVCNHCKIDDFCPEDYHKVPYQLRPEITALDSASKRRTKFITAGVVTIFILFIMINILSSVSVLYAILFPVIMIVFYLILKLYFYPGTKRDNESRKKMYEALRTSFPDLHPPESLNPACYYCGALADYNDDYCCKCGAEIIR